MVELELRFSLRAVLASCSGTVEVYITCREKLENHHKVHKLRFCI
jgi:hypothetical protein